MYRCALTLLLFLVGGCANHNVDLKLNAKYYEIEEACYLVGKLTNLSRLPLTGNLSYKVAVKDEMGNQIAVSSFAFTPVNLSYNASVGINFPGNKGMAIGYRERAKELCDSAVQFEVIN